MTAKLEILKGKIKRIIEGKDEDKRDFLMIIACHGGFVISDSITTSFRRFKEKHGEEKFQEIVKGFKEDGIIAEKYGLHFAVLSDSGDYDYTSGNELSKFTSKLIFDFNPQIKHIIDEILREPEGIELLKYVARENGITIIDGQEPKIKEIVGKRSFEEIVESLVKANILVEYAWWSWNHGYTGYKLLPSVGEYLRGKLGIFELTDIEKTILAYIGSIEEIFSYPTKWYVWFNYPDYYDHKILNSCSLHKKLLASLLYRTEEDVQKTIDDLKSKNLITQVDLGYTRGGSHRGIVLQLSEIGQRMLPQIKDEIKMRIESKIKEVFSNQDTRAVYYLFCHEKIPLSILQSIKQDSVNILLKNGFISDKPDVFLAFNKSALYQEYITSGVNPEEVQKELREKCASLLSQDEKMFLGFLSECGNLILEKYPDWSLWGSATARTQRRYDEAYRSLIVNFAYLKKLFSYLTGLPFEKVDEITSNLEKKMFLVQEKNSGCGFPGYVITYKLPVKFSFDIEKEDLKSKLHEYVDFLAKNIERHYNQLIFLDYLTQIYDARECQFLVDVGLVNDLLTILNYSPPSKYLPIYAFEDKIIVFHPWFKDEIKKEIYELKSNLNCPLKNIILQSTEKYRNNVSYNFSEKTTKEGYFVVEIESPDPSVGTVSFLLVPWLHPIDIQRISSLTEKSNTINIFIQYPNYPELKKMLGNADGRYNLFITRGNTVYMFLKKLDLVSDAILVNLREQFKVIEEEEGAKDELQEIMEKFPNLAKVRMAISEAEKFLKDLLREFFIKQFGEKWEEKIKDSFPEPFKTWERRKEDWKKKHPEEPKDILEFPTLGELRDIINSFPLFLKGYFTNSRLVQDSIAIFLEKKIYHHGRPETDISEEEVKLVRTAFRNLKELRRGT